MANEEHLARLKQGVAAWNQWRHENREIQSDLSEADLSGADLSRADLFKANFFKTNLARANLSGAKLYGADLRRAILVSSYLVGAYLSGADLSEADLSGAFLRGARLVGAYLVGADLTRADLIKANFARANLERADLFEAVLIETKLIKANLVEANLTEANLTEANLSRACLSKADLSRVNLSRTNLCRADLSEAHLNGALLLETDLRNAKLAGCAVYGISAWGVHLEGANQVNLIITPPDQPTISVDHLEVGQFIYLLLHNEKIREVIDTIGKKGVLILGRFAGERKAVLDALRTELRQRNFLPMVFDFEKPTQRDFTETIMTLAGLSLFVIADLTNPRSAPLELQATVPDYMIPFVPIIAESEPPFSMFIDLQRKFDWVLDVLTYDSIDHLLAGLQDAVITPALRKHEALIQRRVRAVGTRHIQQYLPHRDARP